MPSLSTKPRKLSASNSNSNHHHNNSNSHSHHHHHHHQHHNLFSSPLLCRHFPTATATLDLLILILVVFSGAFLIFSYFSYIIHSLSLLLPALLLYHSSILYDSPFLYALGFVLASVVIVVAFWICCGFRSRKCNNPKCKGLKKAMEFDLQLQTEECLKLGPNDVDRLPWKGASESNPDYECLRAELRKMAPPNGRAVLLFRARCGCPVSKLVGWGPKRGRKHKKALLNSTANGHRDHR